MIKPNELRIGNYVEDRFDIKNIKVSQIELDDFVAMSNYKNCRHPNYYHPIPLTAEWLERCGFVKDRSGWHLPNTQFSLTDNLFPCWLDRMLWPGGLPDFHHVQISSLHQLQNLYFALAGEELSIKETV